MTTTTARALRGFCVGIGSYVEPGDEVPATLPGWLFRQLLAAGSIEVVAAKPAAPAIEPEQPPQKPGAARR